MGIGIQLVSFIIWVVVAIFFLGGSRQKMVTLGRDMDQWKTEWKERDKQITRMDLEGSVATKNFIHNYDKEQAKQYERIKHLEDEVNHLDSLELRIERLEKRE
jgi:Sec-independent protein translocase protein TatA